MRTGAERVRHDITSDGITVWVNGTDGLLGRFGRNGIDVHKRAADQQMGGECLHCTHGLATVHDWHVFRAKMLEHFGIDVPETHRPHRFRTMPFQGAVFIDSGRNRIVYRHGERFVVKIPLNPAGREDNFLEATTSSRHGSRPDINGVHYARCRLMRNGWLVMEYVSPVPYQEYVSPVLYQDPGWPKWADYVDCGQIGRTHDGRLVAYDYGHH